MRSLTACSFHVKVVVWWLTNCRCRGFSRRVCDCRCEDQGWWFHPHREWRRRRAFLKTFCYAIFHGTSEILKMNRMFLFSLYFFRLFFSKMIVAMDKHLHHHRWLYINLENPLHSTCQQDVRHLSPKVQSARCGWSRLQTPQTPNVTQSKDCTGTCHNATYFLPCPGVPTARLVS